MLSYFNVCLLWTVVLFQDSSQANIYNVEGLLNELTQKGSSAKVAFLTQSNYDSVKFLLPHNAKPFLVAHDEDLIKAVLNGSVQASLMTGLPEPKYHDQLNIFGSTVVTMQSILMAPDYGPESPHGISTSDDMTYDLARAINAAVASVIRLGIDQQLARKNAPKEIAMAHTCKADDKTQFSVPNKKDATGKLKRILTDKNINVFGIGPYHWGENDGDYTQNPPIGFYPDLLTAIVDQITKLAGPDHELYGPVNITRVYSKDKPYPWYKLFNGEADISEPYFIYDSAFQGSGQKCSTSDNCPNAANLPERKESCSSGGFCLGPHMPRSIAFRSTCTTTATEAQFVTKKETTETGNGTTTGGTSTTSTAGTTTKPTSKHGDASKNVKRKTSDSGEDDDDDVSGGAVAAIVILSIALVVCFVIIVVLIYKEKKGHPACYPY